jgi:hypothetical protein
MKKKQTSAGRVAYYRLVEVVWDIDLRRTILPLLSNFKNLQQTTPERAFGRVTTDCVTKESKSITNDYTECINK